MSKPNKEQALQSFWASFNIPAYDESTVPDGAELPYITYSVSINDFKVPVVMTANIWYKDTSWSDITAKYNEIADAIGIGGKMIPYEEGAIWLYKGSPFAQRVRDEDDMIRRIYLNIEAEYIGK